MTPKIRFKGFSDNWKSIQLKEISKRITRKNKDLTSELPLTISAQYGLVDQKEFFNKVVASSNLTNYILIKKGEFAYNKSYSKGYPFGAIKRLNRYKYGALSTLYIVFKLSNDVSSNFFEQYYNSNYWYKEVYRVSAEGARNHGLLNISPSDFFDSKLSIPSKKEQSKIGNLLSSIEKKIEIQQMKLDNILSIKYGYLQKLFVKNNEYTPKLRFKGFNDNWEENTLSKIFVKRNYLQVASKDYPLMSFVKGVGVTPKGDRYDRSALVTTTNKKYKVTKLNDFIYSSNNFSVGSIGINRTGNATISPVYEVFKIKSNYDVNFVGLFPLSAKFIYNMNRFKQGVVYGQWKVKSDDFLQLSVKLPSLEEQKKIGRLIKLIDNNIQMKQTKLFHLKKLKNGYLQIMFI